jgi:ribosomal protein S18 acetylase RimI-like enzyme
MALDGSALAGACINRVLADEIDRTGIREGWIGTLGVLKSGRGRGIGTALLCESMRLFKAAGYSVAGLSVDTENLTGALGLYERLGFISIQRALTYAKRLTSS